MAEHTGISGTDIAPLLGISPFGSKLKTYCRVLDIGESQPASKDIEFRRRWEPVITGAYLEAHPELAAWNPCPRGYEYPMQHRASDLLPELREPQSLIVGTPDRILVDSARPFVSVGRMATGGVADPEGWLRVLELKTSHYSKRNEWGPSGTDEIPDYYLTQVIWYEMLTGLPSADVAALIGDFSDYREYSIPFDPELGGMMLVEAKKFWQDHIIPRIPPLEVGSADGQALARVFPKHKSDDLATSTPEIDAIVQNYRTGMTILGPLEESLEAGKNKLKAIIGEHSGIKGKDERGEDFKITWRARKDGEKTDWQALATALGATKKQIAAHTKTVPGARVFLANFKEAEE